MLDDLSPDRRQYRVSAITSAPALSSNGWFTQERAPEQGGRARLNRVAREFTVGSSEPP
jgi:hypothetical protein